MKALLSLLVGTASAVAWAQPARVDLVPAATHVTFTLDATGHVVNGSFVLRTGTISFDSVTGEASGEIVVDVTTGRTGNDRRDRKMHDDVLQSSTHPTAIFRPKRIRGSVPSRGEAEIRVDGVLSLHGADHEFTLPLRIAVDGHTVSAEGEFSVPYVAWGLEDPSVFVLRVAKEVTVRVDAKGTFTSSPAPRTP